MKKIFIILICLSVLRPIEINAQRIMAFHQKRIQILREQGAYTVTQNNGFYRHSPVFVDIDKYYLLVNLTLYQNDYGDNVIRVDLKDEIDQSLKVIKSEIKNNKNTKIEKFGNNSKYDLDRNVTFIFEDGVQKTVKCKLSFILTEYDILSIIVVDNEIFKQQQLLVEQMKKSDIKCIKIGNNQWTFKEFYSHATLKLMYIYCPPSHNSEKDDNDDDYIPPTFSPG